MEKSPPVDMGELLNKRVTVQVKSERTLKGTLKQYDDYMNLLLEDVEECEGEEVVARHKLMLVKGGNVRAITV